MLRLARLSTDFIPDDTLLNLMQTFYKPDSRDDKIANDRFIINVIKIVKQVLTTLVTTYFLGLLWYRFSDNWQKMLIPDEPEERYWVVYFGLREAKHDLFLYQDESGLEGDYVPLGSDFVAGPEVEDTLDARRLFGGTQFGIEPEAKLN